MKTPAATEITTSACQHSSANFTAPGRLPVRLGTVVAEVLARLLNHESLTSLDAVFDASTTRLAAVVFYLESDYGWTIERRDIAAGCKDGRVAWVTEYRLDPLTIEAAMAAAGKWCAEVRRARAALRKKAAQAQRQAALANIAASARRHVHPGQRALFDLGSI